MPQTTLIRGGTVITMNPARDIIPEGDVLIEGDRLKAIDRNLPRAAGLIIEAGGKIVLPGLIQSHIHLTQTLFRGLADDLELMDWLKKRIWPLEAHHSFESNAVSARLGIAELIQGGTTSVIDMGTVRHTEALAEVVRETGYRALIGKCLMDHGEGLPEGLREDADSALRESLALLKKWHGAAQGRISYAFAPRFALSCSHGLLESLGRTAREYGVKIHTHASENKDEAALVRRERGLDNVAYFRSLNYLGPDLILAHCVWLSDEEMKMLADTGTMIAHCPSSNLKLASGVAKIPELLAMGANVSLGADGAPCNNNLSAWTEMRQAALIQKARLLSPTALPADKALEMVTLNGARALGQERDLGSLEAGKKADLIIVDLAEPHSWPQAGRDPVARLVYSAQAHQVTHTMVNGRLLMADRKLLTINLAETLQKADRLSDELSARAGLSGSEAIAK